MEHIEKFIRYSPTGNNKSIDRANEIKNWDVEYARRMARLHSMELTQAHIDVIIFLRDYYVLFGWPKRPHELSRILHTEFEHLGGKKYLHYLFPKGPLTQGTQLGGLPGLANVIDKSFGTAH